MKNFLKDFLYVVPLLIALLMAAACDDRAAIDVTHRQGRFPYGVQKFEDGEATCYVYFQNSISCVRQLNQ